MRIVVIGGTGNVGTSVIDALSRDESVDSILGIARRLPDWQPAKTEWAAADVTTDDLAPHLAGADVAIHLAWAIQPSRDGEELRRVIVYASSIGAYSPAPKDRAVDESWPTAGIPSSFYSRHKAAVEAILDRFEEEHPDIRVVRLRPGLIMKAEAATEIRRLFAGPFLPPFVTKPGLIPAIPRIPGLRVQAVHSLDIGEAYRLAATRDVRGPFNIAAAPTIDPDTFAAHIGARTFPLPGRVARRLTDLTWRARLQPTPPGWLDMALRCPVMDTRRAREELGWTPRHDALEAITEVLEGIAEADGFPTPPLDTATGGPARAREIATGVGGTNP
jgi:UDP-glucose 4-epimerase